MEFGSDELAVDADAFWRDGFVVIRGVSPAEEIAAIRPIYDGLFARRAGEPEDLFFDFVAPDGDMLSPQMGYPSRFAPALRHTRFWTNGFAVARRLLGGRPRLFIDHAMLKPPHGGRPTPWHQDGAFGLENARGTVITIWMPLQDVDRSSGCLEFMPASHRGPVLPHRHVGGDPRSRGLEISETVPIDEGRAVACPLRAGDATVHHGLTLHRSYPNIGGEPRRAYALVFSTRWRPQLIKRLHPWNKVDQPNEAVHAAPAPAAPAMGRRPLRRLAAIEHKLTLALRSMLSR
jgi:ectoine hydroxylase-related dioxygenase (phytanoyl-CoA dioxygenase family)